MSRVHQSTTGRDSMRQDVSMTRLWHGVIDDLRLLPSIPGTTKTSPDDDLTSPSGIIIAKSHLDDALKKLKTLIEMHQVQTQSQTHTHTHTHTQNQTQASASASEIGTIPRDRASTPVSAAAAILGGGNNKRKRGLDLEFSTSPGPVSGHARASPSAGFFDQWDSSRPVTRRDGTPSSAVGSGGFAKVRKDKDGGREYTGPWADQLPLQPGRKVVYRTPESSATTGDLWILCQVKRCLGGDKLRYEVQDADDENATYNTSLKSIIPLPDPSQPPTSSSHPSNLEDYPIGTQVLGLYPDTTSFYQATVKSAPIPGTGHGLGLRGGNGRADPMAVKKKYRLHFVDDGDNIHEIHKDSVIRLP